MAIILLILITIAVFTVNGSIVRETKVINSGARAQLAFEAAEAGLANAIDYFSNDPQRIDGVIDKAFYHDSDGDAFDGGIYAMSVGNGRVEVKLIGSSPRITIESTGYSDDSTARRVISQIVGKPDPLPNLPGNPLTAITDVNMKGSSTIENPEGNFNIWTGGDVDLSQNNSDGTLIADPQVPGYPDCMFRSEINDPACTTRPSSDKDSEGQDMVQNDASLANLTTKELFQYYFGMYPDVYRDYVATLDLTGSELASIGTGNNAIPSQFAGQIIWIRGNASLANKLIIGCDRDVYDGGASCDDADINPSIFIVDGDVEFGGVEIYGLVYVTGNVAMTSSTDIQGALIVGGSVYPNTNSGSLDLVYNSPVLERARENGNLLPVAGTWKDFKL
jgi:hypothetical protein